ncbi:hypothetical protein C1645_817897 [Glomus cerebriforme]|uniref:Uncharacterized protein n=1 Tax=Glomus cerebriforme TaxID=658196 RepID=A0A397TDJ8_9GLOM|nr:hypothetical protein C1645_817897 [Glomus cerebriforme]
MDYELRLVSLLSNNIEKFSFWINQDTLFIIINIYHPNGLTLKFARETGCLRKGYQVEYRDNTVKTSMYDGKHLITKDGTKCKSFIEFKKKVDYFKFFDKYKKCISEVTPEQINEAFKTNIKCQGNFQESIRKVASPDYYVKDNQIILKNNVMLNSDSVLILNNGKPVEIRLKEEEKCKHVVQCQYQETDIIFEQLCKGTDLSLILHIKANKSVMIISDLISEYPVDSYYIADSIALTDIKTKFTILLTMLRNNQWHEFKKKSGVLKYYSSLWAENEIMDVWKWTTRKYLKNELKNLLTYGIVYHDRFSVNTTKN